MFFNGNIIFNFLEIIHQYIITIIGLKIRIEIKWKFWWISRFNRINISRSFRNINITQLNNINPNLVNALINGNNLNNLNNINNIRNIGNISNINNVINNNAPNMDLAMFADNVLSKSSTKNMNDKNDNIENWNGVSPQKYETIGRIIASLFQKQHW